MPTNPAMPNCDPSLFLIQYSKAAPRDTIPAASVPLTPQLQQQAQTRRMIQAQGQLTRKEFMLHDRSNWPTIAAPQAVGRRRGGSTNEPSLEEEEDVSRGDILDFMSPRDISRARYEQHHEWMEEILESPYNINQIIPGDLGLGRKGELEVLTKDFFDAPITVLRETSGNEIPRVGKLENGKADNFTQRATRKIAEMEAEIERLKKQHTERIARLKRTSVLNAAEKKLRSAPTGGDRRVSSDSPADQPAQDVLDDIAGDVESSLGRKIERVSTVALVSRGGLEDRAPDRSMSMSSQSKPQMSMSPVKAAASPAVPQQQPQQQSQPQQPAQSQQQAPVSMLDGSTESKGQPIADASNTSSKQATPAAASDLDGMTGDLDVNMDEFTNDQDNDEGDGDDLVNADNDWVMDMGQDDGSNENNEQHNDEQQVSEEQKPAAPPAEQVTESKPALPAQQQSPEQTPNQGTPADHSNGEHNMEGNEFGEAFENVGVDDDDTAGDALASYGGGNDDDELNLDGMDDSAFGDAFQSAGDHDDLS